MKELLAAGATAVVVASPTSTHADVAEELLDGGADVMVEKPITVTLAEADRLVASRGRRAASCRSVTSSASIRRWPRYAPSSPT